MRLFALAALLAGPAHAELSNTVQFTPVIRLYDCPATFTFRSDCAVHEKTLPPQKLDLNVQVLTKQMGQWTFTATDPVPANYYVIVVRGATNGRVMYSVSAETGLPGSASPYANGRVEFYDNAVPDTFSVSSATMVKEGRNFLTEIRLTQFQSVLAARKSDQRPPGKSQP